MVRPIEVRDGVTIYQGDALDVMRDMDEGTIDAIITDPPYCSGGFTEAGKRQAKGQGLRSETIREIGWFVNDNMTTAGLVWLLRSMAVEAYYLLKDGGSLCVFTDWRMLAHLTPALESSGLRYQNLVVWNKGNPGLGFGFRPQHEMVMHFVKGQGKFHDMATGNVIDTSRVHSAEKHHQTEKPTELMTRLIRPITPPGGVILDPFCGSGSTGVAALQGGYKFIGIERDPTYFEVAHQRLANAKTPLLYTVDDASPEQLPLAV